MNPRLFMNVATMQARRNMSYRADFWINATVGFAVTVGVIYFLWRAMYDGSGETILGGYTFPEMLTYYILIVLLGKVIRGGVEFGAGTVAEEIYDGSLTRYLIYPVKYFPFKYAQQTGELVTAILQLVLFGAACVIAFPWPESMSVSAGSIGMCLVSLAVANVMHFALYCPVELVAFWQDQVWSLRVIMRFGMGFLGGTMLPLTLFPDAVREALMWTPFPYLYHLPVNALIGKVSIEEWVRGIVVSAAWITVMALITRLVWKRGASQYTGVGI